MVNVTKKLNNASGQRDSRGRFLSGHGIGHRFQPGESGNPGGRKRDPGITPVQVEMLDKPCPYANDPKKTWRQWLAERGLIQALDKEVALEHLKDRLEGKVTQPIGGDEENPIYIINVPSEQGKRNIKRVMDGDRT